MNPKRTSRLAVLLAIVGLCATLASPARHHVLQPGDVIIQA